MAQTSSSTANPTTSAKALNLEALLAAARAQNLRIQVDESKVFEAKALQERARALAFPSLNITTIVAGPTPEAKTTEINVPSTITDASKRGDLDFGRMGVSLRADGQLVQPIYTFGKISAAKRASKHFTSAAKHRVELTTAEVLLQVHQAFWTYQLTQSYESSLTEGRNILKNVADKIEILLEDDSPQVTENDKLRVLHAQSTIDLKLQDAKHARRIAQKSLQALIGRTLSEELPIVEREIETIENAPPLLATVIQDSFAHRPELAALRSLVHGFKANVDLQSNGFWPVIFLGGAFRFAYTTNATDQTSPFLRDDYNYFEVALGVGMKMELDIWNKLAKLSEANAKLKTHLQQEKAAAQAVDFDVRITHQNLQNAYKKLSLLEKSLRTARSWLNTTVLAYDIGAGNAAELIDAFVARATAEGEYKKTCYDIHIGHVQLQRASGKLR